MLEVRDSFLHFLGDNLSGITIHPLRFDPDTPAAQTFAMNALNVKFNNLDMCVDVSTQHVSLDVVADTDDAAVAMMTSVWQLLSAAFFCPLLDYTDVTSPVPLGTNHIFWDRYGLKFRNIASGFYAHYSCSLKLGFTPAS